MTRRSVSAARCSSWVTITNVWPKSRRRSKNRRWSSARLRESRLPDGSSASTAFGSLTSRRAAPAPYQRGHGHVLEEGELRQQLMKLEHEAHIAVAEPRQLRVIHPERLLAVETDAPAVRTVERAHDLEQSRLAGPARTDYRHDLARIHPQVDALEHLQTVEALPYALHLYHDSRKITTKSISCSVSLLFLTLIRESSLLCFRRTGGGVAAADLHAADLAGDGLG